MNNIFKPVPDYEDLTINQDGTVIYYNGKLKTIGYTIHSETGRKYKVININNKTLSVARLVFAAHRGKLPKNRRLMYLDGNINNTSIKNLWPNKMTAYAKSLCKKVTGFDEVYVNNNGTLIFQNDFEVAISKIEQKDRTYFICSLNTNRGVKMVYVHTLVNIAYNGGNLKNKVIHLDNNQRNNHFTNLRGLSNKEFNKYLVERSFYNSRGYNTSIPKSDTDKVKRMLLDGKSLKYIADLYGCSDMSIVRFKQKHFKRDIIRSINKANGINTDHTPDHIVCAIVEELKQGKRQIDLSHKYNVSPTVVCRINRKYIKKLK